MSAPPRGLSPEEAAVWRKVTATVEPLHPLPGEKRGQVPDSGGTVAASEGEPRPAPPRALFPKATRTPPSPVKHREELTRHGLDGSWERRLAKAQVAPELTIDLHGLNLDQAHGRVLAGLAQASALGARVVLVIAGKPRPHEAHDPHGSYRGAIRARLLDWLAASEAAGRIAAVRPAHPRHGGAGAVYVILRRAARRDPG